MSNEIKRMNYFDGLLLKEEDLTLEQDYHMKLQRLHNRFFHDWGIVDGLEVEKVDNFPYVTVKQGLALNRIIDEKTGQKISQEIWVCDNHPDNPVDLSQCDVNKNIFITVSYHEEEADVDNKKGGDKEIHVWERAKIKYSLKMPDDPRKEIVLACVVLKNDSYGNKVVDTINPYKVVTETTTDSVTGKKVEKTKNIQVCTYAVTQGTSREFEKISIGEKDKADLPYINGFSTGTADGLEIHSPYTKFTGTILSGDIQTTGEVEVNGTLKVKTNAKEVVNVDSKGDVYLANTATVGKTIYAAGLKVQGENPTIEAGNLVLTGKMLTINKKDGELDKSGIEVYRGGPTKDAKLVWDESKKAWTAGTAADPNLYPLAYGPAWDAISGSSGTLSNADSYHSHSKIEKAGVTAIEVDGEGNVDIAKTVRISGNIIAVNGIEVPRDKENLNARLKWNETSKHWEMGFGDNMNPVPYGEDWNTLISAKNPGGNTSGAKADQLHKHSEIVNIDGQVVMSASANKDVQVSSNLAVAKGLTVDGNLTVKGTTTWSSATEYKTVSQVVTENVVIVNKPDNGVAPKTEGGLEVYRGKDIPNARLIWDESSDSWKISKGSSLVEIPSGIEWEYLTHGELADNLHKHNSLYNKDYKDKKGNIIEAVTVDKNGNLKANSALSVAKDAQIKGELTVDGSLTLNGNLKVTGEQTIVNKKTIEVEKYEVGNSTIIVNKYDADEGGLEVYCGGNTPNPKLLWDDYAKKWKISTKEQVYDLPYGEKWNDLINAASADELHTHSILSDTHGNAVLDVNADGNITIDNDTTVNGSMLISGDLDVKGKATFIERVDMQVNDKFILLNKFEGDTPKREQSGIEIFRGTARKARLAWDEDSQTWKAGYDNDLHEIACGPVWDKLKNGKNVDALHMHAQLYNEIGDVLALTTRASGSVDVLHDLNVGQDLTILGTLDVRGKLTRIESQNIEIVSNSVTLNRFDTGDLPQVDSGITVFRGQNDSAQDAIMVWDEKAKYWKIGLSPTKGTQQNGSQFLKVKSTGDIETNNAVINELLTTKDAKITGSLTVGNGVRVDRLTESAATIKWDGNQWKIGTDSVTGLSITKDGKVGIGNPNPGEKLDITGNVNVNGKMAIGQDMSVSGSSVINGSLKAGSAEFYGGFKITGDSNEMGIEVSDPQGKFPTGKLVWNKKEGSWKFGSGDNLSAITISGTSPGSTITSKILTPSEAAIALSADNSGNIGIGTTSPAAKLDVNGDAKINGTATIKTLAVSDSLEAKSATVNTKLTVKNSLEALSDIVVSGKVITKRSDKNGKSIDSAVIFWSESLQEWQAGTSNSYKSISLSGHTHTELSNLSDNSQKLLALTGVMTLNDGKIEIGKAGCDLNLYGNTIMNGYFTAKGNIDALSGKIRAQSAEIMENLSAANVGVSGKLTVGNGIDIKADTDTNPRAQIVWKDNKWQAGAFGKLQNISYENHTHADLSELTGIIAVNDKNINIGKDDYSSVLTLRGNTTINGFFTASGNIDASKGTVTAANVGIGKTPDEGVKLDVAGDTKVNGKLTVKNGIDIAVGTDLNPKAQIVWDDTKKKLQTGSVGSLKNLCYEEDLTAVTNVVKVNEGNVGIGKIPATGVKLDVGGNIAADNITSMNAEIQKLRTELDTLKAAVAKLQGIG